jgi:hypothetical protein
MSARVRLARDDLGRLEAVKVATSPDDAGALAYEADVLEAVRHPGVVDLVELREGPEGPELATRWVGTRSLADVSPLPIEAAIGVVASLAATLADLHGRGIVHRAIEPTHVLIDHRGRPVLCSFGRCAVPSGLIDATPASLVEDASDATPRPSDDIAALGEILAFAVGPPGDPELVPTTRFRRRRTNHLHRDVLLIADHARADDPTCRPSAAAIAHALAELTPDAVLPEATRGTARATHSTDEHRDGVEARREGLEAQLHRLRASASVVEPRPRRRWPIVAGAAGVALTITGVATIVTGPSGGEPRAPDGSLAVAAPSRPAATVTVPTSPPVDRGAPTVELAGARYEVGAPGDVAVVAPWRCDGRPRPLLLRPTTGELFLFDTVATPGIDSVAAAFTAIADARSLRAVDPLDPCPAPTIERADGTTVVVPLPKGPR